MFLVTVSRLRFAHIRLPLTFSYLFRGTARIGHHGSSIRSSYHVNTLGYRYAIMLRSEVGKTYEYGIATETSTSLGMCWTMRRGELLPANKNIIVYGHSNWVCESQKSPQSTDVQAGSVGDG